MYYMRIQVLLLKGSKSQIRSFTSTSVIHKKGKREENIITISCYRAVSYGSYFTYFSTIIHERKEKEKEIEIEKVLNFF